MQKLISKRAAWVGFVLSAVALMAMLNSFAWGEDKTPDGKKTPASARGRLPAHYGDVIDEAQRGKIYAIQEKHKSKIAELRQKLKVVVEDRDAEIRAVLTADQLKKIDELSAKDEPTQKEDATEKSEPAKKRDKKAG